MTLIFIGAAIAGTVTVMNEARRALQPDSAVRTLLSVIID